MFFTNPYKQHPFPFFLFSREDYSTVTFSAMPTKYAYYYLDPGKYQFPSLPHGLTAAC